MNKNETAVLTRDIGNVAADLLLQINKHKIKPNLVEQFYLGILVRERVILRDIANVFENNHEQNITSVFILFRTLLDDFIRLFSVYVSKNMEEEIIRIQADAYNHRFKNLKESIEINDNHYDGNHNSLLTDEWLEKEKQSFLSNPEFDKFFEDKVSFKFKKLTPISKIFDSIKSDVKTKANVHSYVTYKFLTQYVHYSNLAFYLERDLEARTVEILQLEEILLYCFKALQMEFEFFTKTYPLIWNDTKITDYFREHVIYV